jgi:hypothetical protein
MQKINNMMWTMQKFIIGNGLKRERVLSRMADCIPVRITNPQCRSIVSSSLSIEYCKTDQSTFNNRPEKENLVFGTTPTDHMLLIEWDKKNQWGTPKIVPYQDLRISPAASCLHYGTL